MKWFEEYAYTLVQTKQKLCYVFLSAEQTNRIHKCDTDREMIYLKTEMLCSHRPIVKCKGESVSFF